MLVLNPAALADYPATFVASTYAPNREVMLEVVRRYPSITVIDLESVLEQVRSIMDRAALAIQYVFLFTLLAGVVVLLAAVQATREERRFEVALLRTLGASRRRVLAALVVEFVSLGVLAGLLAAADRAGRRVSARDARVRARVRVRSARARRGARRGWGARGVERCARDLLGRAPAAGGRAGAGELVREIVQLATAPHRSARVGTHERRAAPRGLPISRGLSVETGVWMPPDLIQSRGTAVLATCDQGTVATEPASSSARRR